MKRFNSRTREGCDYEVSFQIKVTTSFQFTHPGGVRRQDGKVFGKDERFNSRTREGCDFPRAEDNSSKYEFQFTHPGGVRRSEIISARRSS